MTVTLAELEEKHGPVVVVGDDFRPGGGASYVLEDGTLVFVSADGVFVIEAERKEA